MKAQSSVEFLVAVSVIILVFTFALTIYFKNSSDVDWSKTYLEARRQCFLLSNSINSVLANGNGVIDKIILPDNINFENYNVTIYSSARLIQISWVNETFSCPIATGNVTNTTQISTDFEIQKGENLIKNGGNRIVVQKI